MEINHTFFEDNQTIAEKLIQLIEEDEKISSSNALSFPAIKNNLPAICNTITKAIVERNLNFISVGDRDRGRQHGIERSRQDFQPEELGREFFLLKQVIINQLKPKLIDYSTEEAIEQIQFIDLIIERVMETSFQSYAEYGKQQIDSLNQQIFLTNQEISRLIADRQDSLSYLVHEIKNPLTSIIGYSDLFLRNQQKKEDSLGDLEHIQQVLKQGRNLLRIINDTSEIDSYQKGYLKLRVQEIDVCTLIENITIGLKAAIEAKKLKLTTSCVPTRLIIKSDALRLQQIITNLLTNAIRYTLEGKIELTCHKIEPNLLEIKVSDTGIRIPEGDRDRIFEQYFRSQKSRENIPEGIGLGLAVVTQLVTMLGGKINLISEIDVGSTFIVTIPLAIVE